MACVHLAEEANGGSLALRELVVLGQVHRVPETMPGASSSAQAPSSWLCSPLCPLSQSWTQVDSAGGAPEANDRVALLGERLEVRNGLHAHVGRTAGGRRDERRLEGGGSRE